MSEPLLSPNPTRARFSPLDGALIAVALILMTVIATALILRGAASPTLADPVEQAFQLCVERTYQKLLADNQKQLAEAQPALRDQLTKFFRKAAEQSTCTWIKSACAKDRNDLLCVTYLEKYR